MSFYTSINDKKSFQRMLSIKEEGGYRIKKGLISPKSLLMNMISTDAIAILTIFLCDICGFPNSFFQCNQKCINCDRKIVVSLAKAFRFNGSWVCGRGQEHLSFPASNGIKECLEKCADLSLLDAISFKYDNLITCASKVLWLQAKQILHQVNAKCVQFGSKDVDHLDFEAALRELMMEAGQDFQLGIFPKFKIIEDLMSTSTIDNLLAHRTKIAICPGRMASFKIEEIKNEEDLLYALYPDEAIEILIGEDHANTGDLHADYNWLNSQVTDELALEINLRFLHDVLGSPIIDPVDSFKEFQVHKMAASKWKLKQPVGLQDKLGLRIGERELAHAISMVTTNHLEMTPVKLQDGHLPSRISNFRVNSTPSSKSVGLKRRSSISENSFNRMVHFFPLHSIISRNARYADPSFQLLTRPKAGDLVIRKNSEYNENYEVPDKINWYGLDDRNHETDSIFDQTTDVISFLLDVSKNGDEIDLRNIAFISENESRSEIKCFKNF